MKKIVFITGLLLGCTILFFSSCEPDDPLAGYDQLNAEVAHLKFFESGRDLVPYGDREYDTIFDQQTARFISYELGLRHDAPGRQVSFTIEVLYYSPDDSVMNRRDHTITVEPDWRGTLFASGYGSNEPGSWQEGVYMVEVYEKRSGSRLASESFVIESESGPVPPPPPPSDRFTISLSASPSAGGTVTGSGTYNRGDSVTVTASANSGYMFNNWTEGGSVVSTSSSYTFTVDKNRTLVANFEMPVADIYTVSVSASPSAGGTVTGSGAYNRGDSVTVTASANSGYTFKNWTEGGSVVSTSSSYTFTIDRNRTLVANFDQDQTPDRPYTITVSGDDSGKDVDGTTIVSRQYDLTVTDPSVSADNLFVELPVDPAYMDDYSEDDLISIEYFDEQTGQWLSAAVMSYYDPQAHMIYFELPPGMVASQFRYSEASEISTFSLRQTAPSSRIRLRVSRVAGWNPTWSRLYFTDSPFVIHFQNILGKNQPLSDADWRGTGNTYQDQDGGSIPNYIGDLHKALNETYTALLTLVDSSGNRIFNPVNQITVYVKSMGDAGNANLGGRMEFNVRMDDYQDMLETVAHEMVHVLQGQYYSGKGAITGRQNRWFIEATAQYFGQLVLGLSGADKRNWYTNQQTTNLYLNVPITSSSDHSSYAAGHFLDWLSLTYSTTLVQDTLRASWGNDLNALSRQLQNAGCAGGINEAFEKYVAYLMTHPEEETGICQWIKNRMARYPENIFNFSVPLFSLDRTFIEFETTVPHLAARYVALGNVSDRSALLVVESKKSVAALEMITYDFVGSTNSDYAGKSSIDENHDYEKEPLTVEDFGHGRRFDRFEQMFLNTSGSSVDVEMSYYLLIAPEIQVVKDGGVSWNTETVGNVPLEYIQGYNVYRGSVKLNDNLIDFQYDSQSFLHEGIKADSDITVQVVDKYDNKWPEVEDRDISLTITPDEILDGRVDKEYIFELMADNIPEEVLYVYFQYDFGDMQSHARDRTRAVAVTDGSVEASLAYIYREGRFYFGTPEATITIIMMDNIEQVELARATAYISFSSVTIQGDRNITHILPDDGRTDFTHDFEAVASPEDTYTFVWNFGDGSPDVTFTPVQGQSSRVSHTYTGLKDGDIFRPRVELRSQAGDVLATDSITISIEADDPGEPVDPGDFETVTIGNQVWMKKNLNIATGNSWCYDNNPANCAIYGRLYDWETAMTACPPGWRLPSNEDWTVLIDYLGGQNVAGGKMKTTCSLWRDPNTTATNESGWSGLPGGARRHDGSFDNLGSFGYWWSASESSHGLVWQQYLVNNRGYVVRYRTSKDSGYSVRCLRD